VPANVRVRTAAKIVKVRTVVQTQPARAHSSPASNPPPTQALSSAARRSP